MPPPASASPARGPVKKQSGGRLDVRIEAEEIVRVELLFQRRQSLVVGAVGGGHALLVILAEIIDIDAAAEGTQGAPAVARPCHIRAGVPRVDALRIEARRARMH